MKPFERKYYQSEVSTKAFEMLEKLSLKSTDNFYLNVIIDLDETIVELTANVIQQFKINPEFKNKDLWLKRLENLRAVSTRLSALHSVSRQKDRKIYRLEKTVMMQQEKITELEKEVEKLTNVLNETIA